MNSPKALSRLSMSSMKRAASRRPAEADLVPLPALAGDSRRGSHISDSEFFFFFVVVVGVHFFFVVDITVAVAVRVRRGDVERASRQ